MRVVFCPYMYGLKLHIPFFGCCFKKRHIFCCKRALARIIQDQAPGKALTVFYSMSETWFIGIFFLGQIHQFKIGACRVCGFKPFIFQIFRVGKISHFFL